MPPAKAKPKPKEDPADEGQVIVRFKFDDRRRVYTLDLTDLTTREQVETEEFFDRPLGATIESGWLLESQKGLAWLAYLARRRREPEFTFENALDALTGMADEDESSPPTKASKAAGSPT